MIHHDDPRYSAMCVEQTARKWIQAGPQAHTPAPREPIPARTPLRLYPGKVIEIYHTPAGWTAALVTRHADGMSTVRQVAL